MSASRLDFYLSGAAGLLVDTNLFVLFTVGTVNRDRIETFKRTSKYAKADYDLLIRVLGGFGKIYSVKRKPGVCDMQPCLAATPLGAPCYPVSGCTIASVKSVFCSDYRMSS
jgi:hypothetical protein